MNIPTQNKPSLPDGPKVLRGLLLTFGITALVLGGAICIIQLKQVLEEITPSETVSEKPYTSWDTALVDAGKIEAFDSEEDFRSWLAQAEETSGYGSGFGSTVGIARSEITMEAMDSMPAPTADKASALGMGAGGEAERVSGTNVQVAGIDEPDIVKTDGKEIYFSPEQIYYRRAMPEPMIFGNEGVSERKVPRLYDVNGMKAIRAFPPEDLDIDSELGLSGEMLLYGDTLALFTNDTRSYDQVIYGIDVSDPTAITEDWKWEIRLKNDHSVVSSRLYGDKIYLVTRAGINRVRPCPIVPLSAEGAEISIPCGSIYHPVSPIPADTTHTVMVIDIEDGTVENSVSFVGSWDSVVYMSENHMYVTHEYPGDILVFFHDFLKENSDIVPASITGRLDKLMGYDISFQAKITELQAIMEDWFTSVDEDEQLRLENEFTNRMDGYYREHQRELQTTGIIKVAVEGLDIDATGTVPGSLLNQFSLDEYDSHLRVATTTGGRGGWGWQFGLSNRESVNDVYVLDAELKPAGSVLDLGLGEKIYSARFIQDKGYVVTFKETDPFYVVDLSDPTSPELRGELKIPGYSSYLHPITKDDILGIGKEEGNVKISLFDVSDPDNPTEKSKYALDEYWSDILNTHHAFLLDADHEIFFLPGSKGGYVFSYGTDELELTKAVSDMRARRALYIDDYLYILADDEIVVLDENDWERVNELNL